MYILLLSVCFIWFGSAARYLYGLMVNVQKIVGCTVLNESLLSGEYALFSVLCVRSSPSAGRGVDSLIPCCNFTHHSANSLPAVLLLIQPRRFLRSGIKALLGPQSEPTLIGHLAVLAQWLTEKCLDIM